MDENNLLLNVRNQYTLRLQEAIAIGLYEGLKQMWDMAKRTANSGEVYREFQNNLKNVKKWNQSIVQSEYKRIVERSKCEWIDDLIKQVFKLNTQYLASVDSRTALMRIKVSVPDTPTFLHEAYVNVARAFWLNVPLLEDRPVKITKLQELANFERAKALIYEAIQTTIMENVPMRELTQESLQPPSESDEQSGDEDYAERLQNLIDDDDDKPFTAPAHSPASSVRSMRSFHDQDDKNSPPSSTRQSSSPPQDARSPAPSERSAKSPAPSERSAKSPAPAERSGKSPAHSERSAKSPAPSERSERSARSPFPFEKFGGASAAHESPDAWEPRRDDGGDSARISSWQDDILRQSGESRQVTPVKPDLQTVENMDDRPISPNASPRDRRDDEIHFFSDAD